MTMIEIKEIVENVKDKLSNEEVKELLLKIQNLDKDILDVYLECLKTSNYDYKYINFILYCENITIEKLEQLKIHTFSLKTILEPKKLSIGTNINLMKNKTTEEIEKILNELEKIDYEDSVCSLVRNKVLNEIYNSEELIELINTLKNMDDDRKVTIAYIITRKEIQGIINNKIENLLGIMSLLNKYNIEVNKKVRMEEIINQIKSSEELQAYSSYLYYLLQKDHKEDRKIKNDSLVPSLTLINSKENVSK